MAKSTKQKQQESSNGEVLELEAEEIPLEKVIDNTLVKHNVTNAVINGLKEKYGELRLKSIDDKESYLECCDARKDVRKYGILAEKICKAGREKANRERTLWIDKEKEVLGKINEVQGPLDEEIQKYENEVERKELEAAQRREESYMKRQQTLLKYGATYDNGSFVLNHVSYEATLVKESDDDIWAETILPKYQREYEKNEAERVAIEKKREEEALAFKKQQADMELQRKELERQQSEFREQQDKLKQDQEQAAKIVQEQKRNKMIARGNQLSALGMTFDFQKNAYVFQDISVDNTTEVGLWSDKEWDDLLNTIAPIIEDKKADLEIKRQEEIKQREKEAVDRAVAGEKEKQRQLAEKIERDRLFAESQRAEQLAQSSDKDKFASIVEKLEFIEFPEMKSAIYKKKVAIAKEKINEIINL